MGLDMYLNERVYLSNWPHTEESNLEEFTRANEVLALSGLKPQTEWSYGVEVIATVLYWRKANQIHNWFVNHVQNDVDDCGTYHVEEEQLKVLRATCEEVLKASEMVPDNVVVGKKRAETGHEWKNILERGEVILNSEVAQELLPSASGFFFGSTDYDNYYISDLVHTIDGIDGVLANQIRRPTQDGGTYAYSTFEYSSSW
jgi:hypothetical protein